MAEREYSFEEIDRQIQGLDLSAAEGRLSSLKASASPVDVISQVCPIYRAVRPILQGLLNLPFIPERWKQAIRTFIRLMDMVCPG